MEELGCYVFGKARARILKQGARRLAKARLLPLYTPNTCILGRKIVLYLIVRGYNSSTLKAVTEHIEGIQSTSQSGLVLVST